MIEVSWSGVASWIITSLVMLVIGLVSYQHRAHLKRTDAHELRIQKLELKMLTKEDLSQSEVRITAAIHAGNVALSERMADTKEVAVRAHARIDNIVDHMTDKTDRQR